VISTTTRAQTVNNCTLGVKVGGNKGFDTALSFQKSLNSSNRLEANIGARNAVKYTGWFFQGNYQWVMPLYEELQWYTGVGAGLGNWSAKKQYSYLDDGKMFVAVNGVVGIEYLFQEYPLLFSIDLTPRIGFINIWDNPVGADLAVSLRYVF
jgi:hypothetical protein